MLWWGGGGRRLLLGGGWPRLQAVVDALIDLVPPPLHPLPPPQPSTYATHRVNGTDLQTVVGELRPAGQRQHAESFTAAMQVHLL